MHDRIIDGSILSGDPGHCVGASGLEAGKILLGGTVSTRVLPGAGRGCVPDSGAQIPIELFRLPVPAPLKAECRPADHKHQQREQHPGSEPVLCPFSPPLPASAGPDRVPVLSVPVHQWSVLPSCNSPSRCRGTDAGTPACGRGNPTDRTGPFLVLTRRRPSLNCKAPCALSLSRGAFLSSDPEPD